LKMGVRNSYRVSAGLAPLIAAGLLLSACGGSDSEAASRPTVTLEAGETSYATLPVATAVPEADAEPDAADTSGVQDYEVQAGDYGIKVADQFGVSLQDLENINGWSDASREFPGPGNIIKIPAGGTTASAPAANPPAAETPVEDTAGGETGEAIPEAGGNCEAGRYTIEAGDTSRFRVAEKFDVTVEAMDAANANTNGYDAFYPGLDIVIPAKDDC
jgi:LysM repeat protein